MDEQGCRVDVSTRELEPSPGDMLRDPRLVCERAEEVVARLRVQQAGACQQAAADGDIKVGGGTCVARQLVCKSCCEKVAHCEREKLFRCEKLFIMSDWRAWDPGCLWSIAWGSRYSKDSDVRALSPYEENDLSCY